MLSILIPIYNFNVTTFVKGILSLAENEEVAFEIILIDDASEMKFRNINSKLEELNNVKYYQLEENVGRAKIRNLLAKKAIYKYLLFTDCDSEIPNKSYLSRYIENLKNKVVICGGRSYSNKSPFCKKELFRWKYGKKRESITAHIRDKNQHRSFMTNNYAIPKSIHEQIKFDETINQYGHEDTLFGIHLKRMKIPILHIDNPLIHIGLEFPEEFIKKTNAGIQNLIRISRKNNFNEIKNDIKLLKISKKLRVLSPLIIFFFMLSKQIILSNLKSKHPSLLLFDIYKLGYYYNWLKREK